MPCTTHHAACECREAAVRRLIEAADKLQSHALRVWTWTYNAMEGAELKMAAEDVRAVLDSLK